MKRSILYSYLFMVLAGSVLGVLPYDQKLKVLHITFHEGCKKDFEEVARELDLDLTSWFVQQLPQGFWEGFHTGNE